MKSLFVSLSVIIFLGSCSPVLSPYTQRIHNEAGLSKEALSQVQFYVSDDIVIHREAGGVRTEITRGEIKIVNGKEVEEIVIQAGTPGVLVKMPGGNLAISFDSGVVHYLVFGPNAREHGKYTMMAKDWVRQIGIVEYAGTEYRATPQSSRAHLLVNLKKINSKKVDRKKAEGRKVGE